MSDTAHRLIPPEALPELGIDYSDMHRRRFEAADRFPKRVQISARKHCYVYDEIMAWIRARIADRDGRAA
jgi:prophage regulatory protein